MSAYATFDEALALACQHFTGVTDKSGQPYILHCLRVALTQSDELARQAGLLHDLVEDTDVTLDDLRQLNYHPDVITAVDLLTHRPEDSYQTYVLRLSENQLARQVKLADLNDNYRLDRVAYRIDHRRSDSRRIEKYILTYQFLNAQLDRPAYTQAMQELET